MRSKSIGILTKPKFPEVKATVQAVVNWLRDRKIDVILDNTSAALLNEPGGVQMSEQDREIVVGLQDVPERTALLVILGLGLMARVWNLTAGVPYAVGIDEPAIVDRSLRILHTGSWNTQPYDYPSLVIYLHALVGIARFLLGAIRGEWASLDGFDVAAARHGLQGPAGGGP